ncbi:MAG: hypothetical protein WC609_00865 [Candidatus Paceibacterota bacterium]|jgi:hypothetical protein
MKKISENVRSFFESKTALAVLCVIGFAVVALLIFSLGVSVGFRKASFGRAWGENYERNFGMGPGGPIPGRDNFPNAHGAIGKIMKIELPTIIVQDKDNTEKIILISDNTQIQKAKDSINASNLNVDDSIIVIGDPNEQGQIEAKFIRVLPLGMPPPLPPQGEIPLPLK